MKPHNLVQQINVVIDRKSPTYLIVVKVCLGETGPGVESYLIIKYKYPDGFTFNILTIIVLGFFFKVPEKVELLLLDHDAF